MIAQTEKISRWGCLDVCAAAVYLCLVLLAAFLFELTETAAPTNEPEVIELMRIIFYPLLLITAATLFLSRRWWLAPLYLIFAFISIAEISTMNGHGVIVGAILPWFGICAAWISYRDAAKP